MNPNKRWNERTNTQTKNQTKQTILCVLRGRIICYFKLVAKPPAVPIDVLATRDADHIHLTWKPPLERQAYIKGYKVQYFIAPSTAGATLSVDKHVQNITINTQDHPGRLFAIRIAGYSDGGVGDFTHPFYFRSG